MAAFAAGDCEETSPDSSVGLWQANPFGEPSYLSSIGAHPSVGAGARLRETRRRFHVKPSPERCWGRVQDAETRGAPAVAAEVFGSGLDGACRYAELLAEHGVQRGLIGPREVDRLWDRHLLNSAVISEQIDHGARVLDIGSGAGLPGIPLALARPDLDVVLVDPMARRVRWLGEVIHILDLPVTLVRGRAETREVRESLSGADVVTARAVAPLGRLVDWCLPLLRPGGSLVAMKGESAAEELDRDREEVARAGGGNARIGQCGTAVLDVPTTVIVVERAEARGARDGRRRTRKDR